VLALVGEQGASKRAMARALSFGVNGLGAALMIMVFVLIGGLSGVEIGIAGGSALLAQRVLEAVFGDDAVRRLARAAADRLTIRVRDVLDGQAQRYTTALDAVGMAQTGGAALRAAAAQVAAQRPPAPITSRRGELPGGALRGAGELRGDPARGWWRRLLRGSEPG